MKRDGSRSGWPEKRSLHACAYRRRALVEGNKNGKGR